MPALMVKGNLERQVLFGPVVIFMPVEWWFGVCA